eukprot:10555947-Alexandrium_andersonii.AAC.1
MAERLGAVAASPPWPGAASAVDSLASATPPEGAPSPSGGCREAGGGAAASSRPGSGAYLAGGDVVEGGGCSATV